MSHYAEKIRDIIDTVEKVVVGKREEITLTLTALLARGHVLIEDVPGVGKTMLVRAIARATGADFKRIQFTPDLLPSDVTGISIYNQHTKTFEFRAGPVMSHILLADEINRTSPKTQSALLEALEEGNVTVDGETYDLFDPFFVMATQNPIEHGGTYPLPEAQLDRFLFRIKLGYPGREEEVDMLERLEHGHPIDELPAVVHVKDLQMMQAEVPNVYVSDAVKQYIVAIVRETRNMDEIELGVSPRGSIALMRAAQAYAYINGFHYVRPDDVKLLAPYTLGHRLVLETDLLSSEGKAHKLIERMLTRISVPATRKDIVK
ncbi:AAA family ATPase [Natribacillus halophilus]|uniref:MoxR-like ATPase n=1 Tax=Natribacillus halophilus TaxID=549003 RepID=A0A1G8PE27_9BACI|nr:MoxR family ATPase [Natribacillus halophilus]SDI90677.1 MoxR-like ATPase [Natribacillus halophilus]